MLHPHHHTLMFFILLLFSSLNYSQSLTTHGDDERGILLSLKQHYWGNPSSLEQWNSTSSPCDWPYISCNFNRSVTGISLSRMNIRGSFPASTIICRLNNLISINFSSNSLWGTIPANLSSCSKLETLDLSTNYLTGKIAGELFSLKMLRSLNLQHNMFSGEISTPMVAYSLESLDLSYNLLNGSIPKDIGNFYNLSYLNLSMNSLSGPIPATLLQLHQLSYLSLASNNLTGEIPARLFDLLSLSSIDLSHNHLSGSIPRGFGELQQLQNIDVSYNKFSGDICETVSHMWDARLTLRICKNHFSGRIPYELVKLKFVERCFDDVNLCSDQQLFSEQMDMELPICPSQRFSDYTIPLHINCTSFNELSKSEKTQPRKPNHTMIVTCAMIAAAAVLIIGINHINHGNAEYGSTRKVDAKSDIYSFGVVLLELTTGREAVTGNEDMNLAQWARKHQREGNSAADALDEEIKDPRYMEAMITVFKLGLACTLSSSSSRPSMKDISQILQRCSENNHMSSESQ
nr:probable LRR receptor-like serine/threonine-protein kinase At4g36180 [Ipomoea trifida]